MKYSNQIIAMFKKLSIVICLVISASSCKKFLNEQPTNAYPSDFVFSDVNGAYKALIGVYSRLAGDAGYGSRLSMYYTVDNDECQGRSSTNDDASRGMTRYTLTAGNTELEKPFNQLFQGIEYANICIQEIPKMSAYLSGNKQLKRMHGEALTLRAQYYLEAIRIWGDLPAQLQPTAVTALSNPFPGRTNRDSIYNVLIEDLRLAAKLVPWRNELASIGDPMDERITKGTVKALRAKIALFRGGYSLRNESALMERRADYLTYYQIARDECADIIASGQHSLNPSFKDLWKNQVNARVVTDPNGELMFQVCAIGQAGSGEDTKLAFYNGPTGTTTTGAGIGTKGIYILPTFFYSFDTMDLRRDVSCAPYSIQADGITKTGLTLSAIADGKYRRDWISPSVGVDNQSGYLSLKWQILRYSDVLLMFAEADNELNGPTAAGVNAVNMVRRRGFGKDINDPSSIDVAPSGKSDFFTIITKERAFELCGEGVRKFDLIRWNLLGTKINETKLALDDIGAKNAPYTNYAATMYYYNKTTGDDRTIWYNSFFKPSPSSSSLPANVNPVGVKWVGSASAINIIKVNRYAVGYTPNKSELFPIPNSAREANPNLSQNPGY